MARSVTLPLLVLASLASAHEPSALTIAVKEAPPFAIRGPDGAWSGLAIELWERVAADLERDFRYRAVDLDELLAGTAAGRYAVGVGAVTATAERERAVDFAHPYYTTGLGIAVRPRGGWLGGLANLFSWRFLSAIGALALVLLAAGVAVWLFERRRNDQFALDPVRGVGDGFWWSAVTMTTVGYGDKTPVTLGGRLVALVWMFAGLIVISSFTAAITTALTVGSLRAGVQDVDDLDRVRVAVVEGTAGARWAERRLRRIERHPSTAAALEALSEGAVQAVVQDEPLLRYRLAEFEDLDVLDVTVQRQDYALVLPPGSDLQEEVDRAVLELLGSEDWRRIVRRYLGR